MLKNKMKTITLVLVMILSLTMPLVSFAENETAENSNNDVMLINETENTSENLTEVPIEENSTTTSEDTFKKSDVYLAGDDITIDYIVDGNLFVVANSVTINSQIGGDAFICANSITVGEQAYIFSNLFACSNNITVNGVVYDLYSVSETLTIDGYIYRDIRVGSNTINIFGTVGRNAFIACDNINFLKNENQNTEDETTLSSQGLIAGNLNYLSKEELSIPEGVVTGNVNFEQQVSSETNDMQEYILSLGSFVATVVVIGLLCLWLAPKFLNNTSSFLTTKKILPAIGFGFLTPVVVVILSILLLILGLTSTIGLLSLAMLVVLMVISTSIFVIAANNVICSKLKIQKTVAIFGMLILSAIVLWLVRLIPYAGSIVGFLTSVIGLGIIVSNLVLKEKAKVEEKVNEEN